MPDLTELADAAADKYHIPRGWFRSLIGKGEGGFKAPEAVSPKGARGVGQLMPQTARDMGVSDPDDPAQNLDGAARYAGELWRKYKGDAKLAEAAYNAGPGRVDRAHGVPTIPETQAYVKRVGLPSVDDLLDTKPMPSVDDVLGPAEAPKPKAATPIQRARAAGTESFGELYDTRREQAIAALKQDFDTSGPRTPLQEAYAKWLASGRKGPPPKGPTVGPLEALAQGAQGFKIPLDVLNYGTSGLQAAIDYIGGRPVESISGGKISAQKAGDVESLALPAAGIGAGVLKEAQLASRARAAGVGAETLRASEAAGAQLPAVRSPAASQVAASGYFRGMSPPRFNRAIYNEALSDIGETYPTKGPVGHEGVKAVVKQFKDAYTTALRRVTVKDDQQLIGDMVQAGSGLKGKPQEAEFDRIVRDDVISKFDKDGISGDAWQSVRSDLRRQSRALARSQDPNQQALGRALSDVSMALRTALDRSAPRTVGKRIDQIDRGYAKLIRIEDAAGRAAKSGGVFRPEDLLASEQAQSGRRAMGRGEGLLQSEAQSAYQRKPGLASRLVGGGVGALIGSHTPLGPVVGGEVGAAAGAMVPDAIGIARNALARNQLKAALRHPAARIRGPNYLGAVDRRLLQ